MGFVMALQTVTNLEIEKVLTKEANLVRMMECHLVYLMEIWMELKRVYLTGYMMAELTE
jgi:hypothetical protein